MIDFKDYVLVEDILKGKWLCLLKRDFLTGRSALSKLGFYLNSVFSS